MFSYATAFGVALSFQSFHVLRRVTMGYAQNSVFSIPRQASRNVSMSSASLEELTGYENAYATQLEDEFRI